MHKCGLQLNVYDGKTKEETDQILGRISVQDWRTDLM